MGFQTCFKMWANCVPEKGGQLTHLTTKPSNTLRTEAGHADRRRDTAVKSNI